MKSLKKIFTLFALFAMVACLSISSFALEPDTAMEEVSSEPDMAMSEADMEADTILEKAIPEISPEAGIVDPVEPADVYPACDHNYITSSCWQSSRGVRFFKRNVWPCAGLHPSLH